MLLLEDCEVQLLTIFLYTMILFELFRRNVQILANTLRKFEIYGCRSYRSECPKRFIRKLIYVYFLEMDVANVLYCSYFVVFSCRHHHHHHRHKHRRYIYDPSLMVLHDAGDKHRVITEPEEAMTLQSADLEEMASKFTKI